jgi:hypothetical protein
MSEIKGPVRTVVQHAQYPSWYVMDPDGNDIAECEREEYANAIRDALNAQARHAEAVRLLGAITAIPAVLSVLGANHVGLCPCPLCKSQAYLEAEKGETNAKS